MKINKQLINKYFWLFILSQPILDLVTSLSIKLFDFNLSAGMIFRFLFMVISIIYLVFVSTSLKKKKSIILLALIFIYIAVYMITNLYINGMDVFFVEIKYLIKLFYFPIILISIWNVIDEQWFEMKDNILIKVAFIYTATILIAQLTGTQFISYAHNKLGHSGWFYSPNELGAILAILSPIVIAYTINNSKKIWIYFLLLAFISSLFIIGTKAPLLGLIISIVSFIVIYVKKMFIKKKNYISVIMFPLMITFIAAIIILPNSPVGINLNIHLKILEVENPEQLYEPKNKEKLTNFVFSSRDIYQKNTQEKYKQSSLSEKIIGMGSTEDKKQTKMIEIDYYDIFYRNGILGFIIYFSPFILIASQIVKKLLKNIKKVIINTEIMKSLISIGIALGIAYFAGHVFVAPAVSIYVIIIINKLEKKLEMII